MENPGDYFRQTFTYDGGALKNSSVVIRHNDNTEIYINGEKIVGVRGSKGYYIPRNREIEKGVEKG